MGDDDDRGAELDRLRQDYQLAMDRAKAILMDKGMGSPEFTTAKQVAAQLWQKILAIDPTANPSDMV